MQSIISKAADLIKNSSTLAIHTGAGMGVDSGLPDFRGKNGFWKAYPHLQKSGESFVDMANPEQFLKDPKKAWAFYGHRLNLYRDTYPHDGFKQLLNISNEIVGSYFVFKSNVDGHFKKSGYLEENIEECHGSINHLQCIDNCTGDIWEAPNESIIINKDTFRATSDLPKCIHCNSLARPNILMFSDWAWNSSRTDKQSDLRNEWYNKYKKSGITVIEIGAGLSIPSVRIMSESIADNIIRINPNEPEGPDNCLSIQTGGLEAITLISKELKI